MLERLARFAVDSAVSYVTLETDERDPALVVQQYKHARQPKRARGMAQASLLQALRALDIGDWRDAIICATYAVVDWSASGIDWLWSCWPVTYDQYIKRFLELMITDQKKFISGDLHG